MIGGEIVANRHENMSRGQAECLFPMLDDVMRDAGAVWDDINAIGVGVGPGNFTGIRIGVSAARGLALARNIPAVGVTTFETYFDIAKSPDGQVAVFAPGPHKSIYFQIFVGGEPEGEPFLQSEETLSCPSWVQSLDAVVGPDGGGLFQAVADNFRPSGLLSAPTPILLDEGQERERASSIAGRVVRKWPVSGTAARPTPLYVRPADAAPRKDAAVTILS